VSVTTYHYDNTRAGQNPNETTLTPTNVNPTTFGRLFQYALDGLVYAQPLYLPGVSIQNQSVHNVVYVVTEHDSVYAFDADSNSGTNASPLWQVSFINPANGVTTIPSTDFGGASCTDLTPEVGITSTPVIDPVSGTMYVLARTKENGAYFARLHALDVTSGLEKFGGPINVTASVPGTGEGGTTITLNTFTQGQRAGLLLVNGTVYIGFSELCSQSPFHGWLLGYNAQNTSQTLAQVAVWTSSANGSHGGIWAGGAAPAADNNANIFLATGEGTFDANHGGVDYGSSVVRLAAPGTTTGWAPLDSFTPYNQGYLLVHNLDLGSASVVLLPDQTQGSPYVHLLLAGGKNGTIYLLNRDALGQFNSKGDIGAVQSLVSGVTGIWGSPAFWNNFVYFSGPHSMVTCFTFNPATGLLSTSPTATSPAVYVYPNGSTPSVSSNGTTNAVVWTAESNARKAIMHAYDVNLNELYNTTMNSSRDGAGAGVRYMVPTVANGKVYLATNHRLGVYGLLPGKK
jgi:hypothetical protein